MKPISQLLTILITYLRTNLGRLAFFCSYQEKVRCKRTEAALWESEARYRSLVNAISQVVWTTNAEGHVVDDLPSWQLLTGQSREAIQGWGWLNAIHPEDQAETARRWTQAIATKGIYEIEHRVRLVNGSYRFFLARGVPVLDLESKILEWVGTHTDITAYKQAQEALYQSQTKFQRLVANMPGMVYRYLPCADGPDQFTFVNSASRELLELEPEMVLQDASSFVELIHPDDLLSFQESVVTSAQNFLLWRWEGRIITPSGHLKWIQGSSRPDRTAEGDVWDGLLIDITERKRAEELLRESEERYALAAQGANDGLWDWNLESNKVYFSPRWKSLLGYEEDEIGDSPDEWFERVHPEDVEQVKLALTAPPKGLTSQFEDRNRTLHSHHQVKHHVLHFHFQVEHRILHKDGTYRWMFSRGVAVQDLDGKTNRLAGSQTDITARKQVEAQLLHNALHDVLTGLANRVLFMDRLGHAIERTKRCKTYLFAVLFLDLDRFKVINDSLGHAIGDQLLMAIAHKLEACVRSGDTVARLGGDEFAILLEDIQDIEYATQVADRIQKELVLPFKLSEHEVFTTVSIGIAPSTLSYDQPEDLLRDADTAMYCAKALGKVQYQVFDRTMHTRTLFTPRSS